LYGPDNRWLWRRGEYVEDVFAPGAKYSKISLHLWGPIGARFKSCFMLFEKNVDSDVYVAEPNGGQFFESADATVGKRGWFLVRDGASSHTSARSMAALFERCNVSQNGRRILPISIRLSRCGGDQTTVVLERDPDEGPSN
jgi:hypothetical protein